METRSEIVGIRGLSQLPVQVSQFRDQLLEIFKKPFYPAFLGTELPSLIQERADAMYQRLDELAQRAAADIRAQAVAEQQRAAAAQELPRIEQSRLEAKEAAQQMEVAETERNRQALLRNQEQQRAAEGEAQEQQRQYERESQEREAHRVALLTKADQARREEAALMALERVDQIPLSDFLQFFVERIRKGESDGILSSADQALVLEIYGTLRGFGQRQGLVDLDRAAQIQPEATRIAEIETLLDLYTQKIRVVRADAAIDDEEREEKIEFWKRLRDRDIQRLEED